MTSIWPKECQRGRDSCGLWFYWYNSKAMETKHIHTINVNREEKKKNTAESCSNTIPMSALLISSVLQLVKFIATNPCKTKKYLSPWITLGWGLNTKLVTQKFKCVKQMPQQLLSHSYKINNYTGSWLIGEGKENSIVLI